MSVWGRPVLLPRRPYTPLTYIESTGTQYIDTGWRPTAATRALCRVSVRETGRTPTVFGTRDGYGSAPYGAFTIFARREYAGGFWYEYGAAPDTPIPGTASLYGQELEIELSAAGARVGGQTAPFALATACAYPLLLFDLMHGGTPVGTITRACMKLYAMRLWEDGTPVRDLRPALDRDGVPCLWDAVTKTFFRNAGSGTFLYG